MRPQPLHRCVGGGTLRPVRPRAQRRWTVARPSLNAVRNLAYWPGGFGAGAGVAGVAGAVVAGGGAGVVTGGGFAALDFSASVVAGAEGEKADEGEQGAQTHGRSS